MKINKVLLSLFLLHSISLNAQDIKGLIVSYSNDEPVSDAYISLFHGDSIISVCQTDNKGQFVIKAMFGENILVISHSEYKDKEYTFSPDTLSSYLYIALEENVMDYALDEVVISADKSNVVKRTANGLVFCLSEEAKKERNPFIALQEIPILISNEANRKVTMLNGETPLILINGNIINSGISPINPSDIESVEVINTVPARYLQDGYNGIVNIKLKKNINPYIWFEAATRHDIPINNGFGVVYFEVGNRKVSLYGRGTYDYTYNDDTESTTYRSSSTYMQAFDSSERTDKHYWLGELILKWSITEKDFLAAHLYYKKEDSTIHGIGAGDYETTESIDYDYSAKENDNQGIITSSLYYKHSFKEFNDLEFRFAYNSNSNDFCSRRSEQWGVSSLIRNTVYNNIRHSGSLEIDYSKDFESGLSFSLGSHSTGEFDRIDQTSTGYPVFKHNKINEYIFGSMGGKIKKFCYMASAGIEMILAQSRRHQQSLLPPQSISKRHLQFQLQ